MDELAGFTAVPNLGVVGVVQAPAAQLTSHWASATHARLVRVEIAHHGFSMGYGRSSIFCRLSVGHRQRSQIFPCPLRSASSRLVFIDTFNATTALDLNIKSAKESTTTRTSRVPIKADEANFATASWCPDSTTQRRRPWRCGVQKRHSRVNSIHECSLSLTSQRQSVRFYLPNIREF